MRGLHSPFSLTFTDSASEVAVKPAGCVGAVSTAAEVLPVSASEADGHSLWLQDTHVCMLLSHKSVEISKTKLISTSQSINQEEI